MGSAYGEDSPCPSEAAASGCHVSSGCHVFTVQRFVIVPDCRASSADIGLRKAVSNEGCSTALSPGGVKIGPGLLLESHTVSQWLDISKSNHGQPSEVTANVLLADGHTLACAPPSQQVVNDHLRHQLVCGKLEAIGDDVGVDRYLLLNCGPASTRPNTDSWHRTFGDPHTQHHGKNLSVVPNCAACSCKLYFSPGHDCILPLLQFPERRTAGLDFIPDLDKFHPFPTLQTLRGWCHVRVLDQRN